MFQTFDDWNDQTNKKNGGFAEFLSIPRSNVLNIPKNKNLYNFTLIEPTAVALHAINLSKKHIDKDLSKLSILIIGAGSIGLLIALILKSKKINKLNMVDFNFKKLEIAKKHTNTSIFQPHQKKYYNKDLILFMMLSEQVTQESRH